MALGMMKKVTMVLEEAANIVPMAMPMAEPSPRSSSLFDIFVWMQEKGTAPCGLLIRWKSILQK